MKDILKGCSCSSGCCTPEPNKDLVIDFLYLDLNVCERCQGTEKNLDQAIQEVSSVLKSAGYNVVVNKINIASEEMAVKYEFLSSPTIRINGMDIELEVKETLCENCGDLCGDTVDCRSWVYEGTEHDEPPKEMIVNAIMKEVYGGPSKAGYIKKEYVLPQNLKVFFDGIKAKKIVE